MLVPYIVAEPANRRVGFEKVSTAHLLYRRIVRHARGATSLRIVASAASTGTECAGEEEDGQGVQTHTFLHAESRRTAPELASAGRRRSGCWIGLQCSPSGCGLTISLLSSKSRMDIGSQAML